MNTLAGLRVLLVEDEPMLAMYLGEVLEEQECVIAGAARTVAEALALVKTVAFDVALLDVNLAGELVHGVAAAVAQRGRAMVFATGAGPGVVGREFARWPILNKPYEEAALFAALAHAASLTRAP